MDYLEAVNRKDFKSARSYVSDNISYVFIRTFMQIRFTAKHVDIISFVFSQSPAFILSRSTLQNTSAFSEYFFGTIKNRSDYPLLRDLYSLPDLTCYHRYFY